MWVRPRPGLRGVRFPALPERRFAYAVLSNGKAGTMNKRCERCGRGPKGEYGILDYCAKCSQDLCEKCMREGCCGEKPAISGEAQDYGEDLDVQPTDQPQR